MKIAFISSHFPPVSLENEVEKARFKIAEVLANEGHSIAWICFEDSLNAKVRTSDGPVAVCPVPVPERPNYTFLKRSKPPLNNLDNALSSAIAIYRGSLDYLAEFKPDVIDLSARESCGLFYSLEANVPLALHYKEGEIVLSSEQKLAIDDAERILLLLINLTTAASAHHYFISDNGSVGPTLALSLGCDAEIQNRITELNYRACLNDESAATLAKTALEAYRQCSAAAQFPRQSQALVNTLLPEIRSYLNPNIPVQFPTETSIGAFDRGFMSGRDRPPTAPAMARAVWRGVKSRLPWCATSASGKQ